MKTAVLELENTKQTIERNRTPWEDNPYGVVSLLDMLKFAAEDFWMAAHLLAAWRTDLDSIASEGRRADGGRVLRKLVIHLTALDLRVSVREFQKFNDWLDRFSRDFKSGSAEAMEWQAGVKSRLDLITSVIHSELEQRIFLTLDAKAAEFYDQKELFGKEVIGKFPTIQFDMTEAGNCLATGRGTACVFHLMRIMEVGVQQFGSKVGVPLAAEKNWQNILDEINKAIRTLPPKDAGTIAMCHAAANLYSVKLAWRNEVMHPNDTYTLEEADNLIRQVKLFMGQLSSIV